MVPVSRGEFGDEALEDRRHHRVAATSVGLGQRREGSEVGDRSPKAPGRRPVLDSPHRGGGRDRPDGSSDATQVRARYAMLGRSRNEGLDVRGRQEDLEIWWCGAIPDWVPNDEPCQVTEQDHGRLIGGRTGRHDSTNGHLPGEVPLTLWQASRAVAMAAIEVIVGGHAWTGEVTSPKRNQATLRTRRIGNARGQESGSVIAVEHGRGKAAETHPRETTIDYS